jgi:hypothetical protein
MAKKHYPVVRSAQTSAGPAANTVVQVDQFLSKLNRRLYRQGRYYQVSVDIEVDSIVGPFEVYALRDDWAIQKAFQLAYSMYRMDTQEERAALGSQVARWEDFRVDDGLSIARQYGNPVLFQNALTAQVLTAGEFELSTVVDTAQTERSFTWGSPGANEYGILEEFDVSANAQGSPSSTTLATPYTSLTNQYDDVVGDALQDHGNLPPYSQTGVNSSSPWTKIATIGTQAGHQKLSTGFFTAPCGFVVIKALNDSSDNYPITIRVKAGDYKGVDAPSMLE